MLTYDSYDDSTSTTRYGWDGNVPCLVPASSDGYGYPQDDAGNRLAREAYDDDGGGEPDRWTDTAYDDAGRSVERQSWSQGEILSRTTRTFSCE